MWPALALTGVVLFGLLASYKMLPAPQAGLMAMLAKGIVVVLELKGKTEPSRADIDQA